MSISVYRSLATFIVSMAIPLHVANAQPTWSSLGGSITGRIYVDNSTVNLHAFVRGMDNALWTNTQTSPGGPWGAWTSLGGILSSNPVGRNDRNDEFEAFALGTDSALWTIAQSSPLGPFGDWRSLGGSFASDPAVIADSTGNLHVFVVGSDQALWTIAETSPGSFGDWTSLGGVILHNPAAVQNRTACSCRPPQSYIYGSIEVFAVGADNALWHNWTVDAAFDWAGWSSLGGSIAGSPAAAIASDDRVTVFGTGTDSALWYTTRPVDLSGSAGWTPFASLGGILTSDPSAAFDSSGPVEAFVRGTDNAVWHITGSLGTPFPGPTLTFGNWATLGGIINNGPTAQVNVSGRLAVLVEGTDTAVWTIEQLSQASWQ